MGTIKTTNIETITGSGTLTLGQSGETITIPSGVTITNNGTQTGFGGVNTPAFSAERSGAQTISNSTSTTILFNNEFYDSDNAYDTSTGRFTPQTAGKYYVSANVVLDSDLNGNYNNGFIELYKNASVIAQDIQDDRSAYGRRRGHNVSIIVDMNGSTDYLLVQAYIVEEIGGQTPQVADMSNFQAYKIIE